MIISFKFGRNPPDSIEILAEKLKKNKTKERKERKEKNAYRATTPLRINEPETGGRPDNT